MKFFEMKKFIEDNKEYGFRFMIADEMKYVIEDAENEVEDEVFEMLCSRTEQAYLKTDEIEYEMWQLCKAVYDMYVEDILDCSSAYDILGRIEPRY